MGFLQLVDHDVKEKPKVGHRRMNARRQQALPKVSDSLQNNLGLMYEYACSVIASPRERMSINNDIDRSSSRCCVFCFCFRLSFVCPSTTEPRVIDIVSH
jgi:hypothetical protein